MYSSQISNLRRRKVKRYPLYVDCSAERLEANDEARNKKIWVLALDEYGALISSQDRKTADELKTMVANMLFMGRSLGIAERLRGELNQL